MSRGYWRYLKAIVGRYSPFYTQRYTLIYVKLHYIFIIFCFSKICILKTARFLHAIRLIYHSIIHKCFTSYCFCNLLSSPITRIHIKREYHFFKCNMVQENIKQFIIYEWNENPSKFEYPFN